MTTSAYLPSLSPEAEQHSALLCQHIANDIKAHNGLISFARFMEHALYWPGLGYYSAGLPKLGRSGDFITAPEISPLFAQCLARQCQQVLHVIGRGSILELGAGTGRLAKDILLALDSLHALPEHYYILEVSADLRARQYELFKAECPQLLPLVTWLNRLPHNFLGVILANEVMDALPVHVFRLEETILEQCVTWQENQFAWHATAPRSPELLAVAQQICNDYALAPGYESEINLMLKAWIHTLAATLQQGVILLLDYGYNRAEYYHPQRRAGTLLSYSQHRCHANPLIRVGLQDITAHVDFTTVAEAAVVSGLEVAGFTSQAAFLLACGLLSLAADVDLDAAARYQQNQAIKLLTFPAQMGDAIKVMALNKQVTATWLGFTLSNKMHSL